MAEAAYAPKAGREDPDHFGMVSVPFDRTLNVRQALEDGNGYIVTADEQEQAALDAVDNLKRVTLEDARKAQAPKTRRAQTRDEDAKEA